MKYKLHFSRIIATLLFLAVSTFSWAYNTIVDGIYYNYSSSFSTASVTYATSSYNSYSGSITIPSKVKIGSKTYDVIKIEAHAFRASSGLTSVTIPNSVQTIGENAFYGCI